MRLKVILSIAGAWLLVTGCALGANSVATNSVPVPTPSTGGPSTTGNATANIPKQAPAHVVLVIEENHSYSEIFGNRQAPYINSLMGQGANFVNYHGVEHPSQPNYLDLFSGSNQGVTSDACPQTFSAPNLGSEMLARGLSFVGYSEGLPSQGYTGCSSGHLWLPGGAAYARKHSPWVNFTNLPASTNQPFANFPTDYGQLPTLSIVIPNLNHDMHNGTIQAGDTWLEQHLAGYVTWAKTHNSLLIVTWDEDDTSSSNQVPTFFVGSMVQVGTYKDTYNHFNLLRTLEAWYGLPVLGKSADAGVMSLST